MRRNSFQVRPPGFTEYFPETDTRNNNIRVFPATFASRESPGLMQSPQGCSMTRIMKRFTPPNLSGVLLY